MDANERRLVLVIATLSSFVTPFMGASLNVALPQMGAEFSADGVTLGWIVTSFLLIAAMFLVPMGKMADIKGRKRVFTFGIWIFAASSFLLACAQSSTIMIALRAVQGLGGAMIFGTGAAILTSVYPAHERGKVLGINVAAVYSGSSLGPFAGGILTQHFGWRSIFVVATLLAVTTGLMTAWKLKGEWAAAKEDTFDLKGSLLFSSTIFALMYGLSSLPAIHGFGLIVAGMLGLAAFILWEIKTEHPVLDVDLFRKNAAFAFSNLAALLNYCATAALGFLLSLYLHFIKGLSPQETGMVLVSQPIVMAIFSPIAGRLSDKIEPKTVASLGMALTCAGLFVLATIDADSSLLLIVGILITQGFGFALFSSPNTNAIMSSVDRRFYGVASGTVGTMRLVGQMLSMGISMLLIGVFIGRVQISPEHGVVLLRTIRVAFLVFGTLCLGGIFASLARGKVR